MPLYRVQVELAMTSGNPLDKATNVWHCIADDLTALDLFITQLTTFYAAVDSNLSSSIATTGHRLRAYDLADAEPRAPVRDQGIGTLALGANAAPPELALCISYQAPQQSGQSQARRRGRIYIGPLYNTAMATATGLPAATTLTTIGGALQNLLDASQAAATWAWAVYSPTNGVAIEATNAWLDNAFDIQRRRGVAATSRTIFT